jgi:NAD(P)-dependent dehydrogenase (short-subunit alcohol dehydrogenase family)
MPTRSGRLARAIEGKRVLIAGASGRLQTDLARRLAVSGAQVILVDDDAAALDELRTQIVRAGGAAFGYRAELASNGERASLRSRILEQHGGVDVLICGASETAPSRSRKEDALDGLDTAACEAALRAHYLAPVDLMLGLLPGMRERETGHVVLLSSVAVDGGSDPARLASAAALDAFATAVAQELSTAGVSVTSAHVPPLKPESSRASATPLAVDVERAADVICDALIHRPRRANTWLGTATEVTRAASPQTLEVATSLLSRLPATRWTPWGPTKAPEGRN